MKMIDEYHIYTISGFGSIWFIRKAQKAQTSGILWIQTTVENKLNHQIKLYPAQSLSTAAVGHQVTA